MITLNADPMSPSANTYTTLVEANTYFTTKMHNSAWENASDDNKASCLVWATRLLDQHVVWQGWRQTREQALRWPRSGVLDPDNFDIDPFTIPQFLKNATAEYAEFLIESDRTTEPETVGFKRLKVGTLELEVDRHWQLPPVPDSVFEMVAPYGERRENYNKLVRV